MWAYSVDKSMPAFIRALFVSVMYLLFTASLCPGTCSHVEAVQPLSSSLHDQVKCTGLLLCTVVCYWQLPKGGGVGEKKKKYLFYYFGSNLEQYLT